MRSRYTRIWLLTGMVAALAVTFARRSRAAGTTGYADAAGDANAAAVRVPPLSSRWPLLGVITTIVVVGALWLAGQVWSEAGQAEAVARAITGGNPANAAALVTRYGCGGCHRIPGLPGADGEVAASLANIRKRVFIGGVLPNTASNMIGWIALPQQYSPRSAMPNTGISPNEARDIAAYLYAH